MAKRIRPIRECCDCGETRTIFARQRCRPCWRRKYEDREGRKAQRRRHYQRHRERLRARHREYYYKNLEKCRAQQHKYYLKRRKKAVVHGPELRRVPVKGWGFVANAST
jgi:hypothetical protein